MTPFWTLAALPLACVYSLLIGLMFCRILGARTQEQVVPVMALSALAAVGATTLADFGRPLAIVAFWSFAHLVALPFVLRLAARRD